MWGLETRECDIVIVFLFLLICVYHQGQRPEYCFWGGSQNLGWARRGRLPQRIWFLLRRLLVRHLLQQSWMYWCVTLSLAEQTETQASSSSSSGASSSSFAAPPDEIHRLKSQAHLPAIEEVSVMDKVWRQKTELERKENHLAHCGTCGSVFVHLEKGNWNCANTLQQQRLIRLRGVIWKELCLARPSKPSVSERRNILLVVSTKTKTFARSLDDPQTLSPG